MMAISLSRASLESHSCCAALTHGESSSATVVASSRSQAVRIGSEMGRSISTAMYSWQALSILTARSARASVPRKFSGAARPV